MSGLKGWVVVSFAVGRLVGCFSPGGGELGTDGMGTDGGTMATSAGTSGPSSTTSDMSTTGGTTTDTTASTTEVTTDSGTDTDGTGGGACDGADGTLDTGCSDPTPFCLGGQCVGCGALADDACSTADSLAPICDAGTGGCVPCSAHGQCSTGACVLTAGACVAEGNRLWVDSAVACGGAGTEAMPFCDLPTAVTTVDQQPGASAWAIFIAGSATPYAANVVWNSDHPLAIVGPSSGLSAIIVGADLDNDNVNVVQGSEIFLADLVLESANSAHGVRCSGTGTVVWGQDLELRGAGFTQAFDVACSATFQRVVSEQHETGAHIRVGGVVVFEDGEISNAGAAMLVEGTLRMRRSTVSNAYVGGGIDVAGGTLLLENSFTYGNGYAFGGVRARGGATVDILYSTMIDGFDCDGSGPSSVRNSIVDSDTCPSAQIDNSAVGQGVDQGMDNALIGPADYAMVFVGGGDYHVLADAPIVTDLAIWGAGDPSTDFDGDDRPNSDGTPDYAGADVP